MKTAPAMPPPRPPRDHNTSMGSADWHNNPNAGRAAKLRLFGLALAKILVVGLLAVALGQLGFILFQIVHLRFSS